MNTEERLTEILYEAGYKYTKPRRKVVAVLLNNQRHLTAPEIVDAVADLDSSIGRMSVYRTLDLFTRLGLVRPAFQNGANARYVVIIGGHHHHLVCQDCGSVVHFDDCPLTELKTILEKRFGFEIEGHLLEFFGKCANCHAN